MALLASKVPVLLLETLFGMLKGLVVTFKTAVLLPKALSLVLEVPV